MNDVVEIPYSPRAQFVPFHQRTQRWACLVVHRRGGKTVSCVNELIARALYTYKDNARYAYLAPFYRQAKDVAWAYLKYYAAPVIKKIRESELRIELVNGAWITLYGADNPDALRGIYLDGVVLDEFGDCRPSLWGKVILPTLVDRGGWAVFIGTPKGKNHFYTIYKRSLDEEGWFNLTLKASRSGIIAHEELEEIRRQMTDEEFDQEMECSFDAAVRGTYYADLLNKADAEGRIDDSIQWDPNQPVQIASDLGYTDSTALWFWQERPDGIAVIDYYEADSEPLPHYFELIQSKPYEYKKIWLPHDAKAKSLQTGRSTIEQFLHEEFPVDLVPKLALQDGVNAVRKILPKCWFNATKCYEGIEALRSYRREYDEVKDSYRNVPVHDWASHPADSFRGLALVTKTGVGHAATDPRSRPTVKEGMTLNSLWEELERREKMSTFNNRRI